MENNKNGIQSEPNSSRDNNEIQSVGEYYSYASPYQVKKMSKEDIEKKEKEVAEEFGKIGIASLVYALVFVLCLYKNLSGITSAIWTGATVYYIYLAAKNFNGVWGKMNTYISAVIIMLGISNFCTDNMATILLNYMVIFVFMATNVVFLFINMKNVNVSKSIGVLMEAVFGSISEWQASCDGLKAYSKDKKTTKNEKIKYVMIGVGIAIPMLVVVTLILVSADTVFYNMFAEILSRFDVDTWGLDVVTMVGIFVLVYVMSYAYIVRVKSGKVKADTNKSGQFEPIVATIVTGTVSVVYVIFSLVQIYYLFMGQGELPQGYTYAEYAREGFFQLLFIAVFNLILVVACIEFFKDSKVLSVALLVVTGCTFVMIASSAYRMLMYINEYGLTYLRIFVLWSLVVSGLIMLGLAAHILWKRINMFSYALVIFGACFVAFSFSHTDYFIAKYNIEMYNGDGNKFLVGDGFDSKDYNYLTELSADAVPVIVENWNELSMYVSSSSYYSESYLWLKLYDKDISESYVNLRNFNISRIIAKKSLDVVNK